jgi:hypothetical protein
LEAAANVRFGSCVKTQRRSIVIEEVIRPRPL